MTCLIYEYLLASKESASKKQGTTLSGQKCFNTFKLCHIVEICMPLKLFVLKITLNVSIYLIIG